MGPFLSIDNTASLCFFGILSDSADFLEKINTDTSCEEKINSV